MTGAASIFLRRDPHHRIRASWAQLEHGVVTAVTPRGIRSWHMSDIAVIKWDREAVIA
jgi:hypothetical protein